MESQIIKVNKQKHSAVVEIEMLGAKREIMLMLELLEKI